jgi:hypothetical protein
MRTSVLHTALAVTVLAGALVVGVACKEDTVFNAWAAGLSGQNVLSLTDKADTAAKAMITLTLTDTLHFTCTVTSAPHSGATDSVFVYSGAASAAPTSGTRKAVLQTGGCTGSGVAASVTGGASALADAMRNYNAYAVITTAGEDHLQGASRGQSYPTP